MVDDHFKENIKLADATRLLKLERSDATLPSFSARCELERSQMGPANLAETTRTGPEF